MYDLPKFKEGAFVDALKLSFRVMDVIQCFEQKEVSIVVYELSRSIYGTDTLLF